MGLGDPLTHRYYEVSIEDERDVRFRPLLLLRLEDAVHTFDGDGHLVACKGGGGGGGGGGVAAVAAVAAVTLSLLLGSKILTTLTQAIPVFSRLACSSFISEFSTDPPAPMAEKAWFSRVLTETVHLCMPRHTARSRPIDISAIRFW